MTIVPDVDVQSALNDRLNTDFPTTPVAWENYPFSPTTGTPYLRAWILPAESDVVTLGPNPVILRTGIFQIDCCYPLGKGWGPAKSKAAEIVEDFKAGTRFVYNGLTVQVDRAWPGPGAIDEQGWYRVPVSIKYSCYYQD